MSPKPSSRDEQINAVIESACFQRHAGDGESDDSLMGRHSHLMPELRDALDSLRMVRQARLSAKRIQQDSPPYSDSTKGSSSGDRKYQIDGYVIQEELGRGGQGSVFRAVHESTGRNVAVKILNGGKGVSHRSIARFEREVSVLARLKHPNIVGVLDRGRTKYGSHFYSMDYIDGTPLDKYIEQRPFIDIRAKVKLVSECAAALGYAHVNGVVHRDLKPSNILIGSDGRPIIIDFGLVRLLDLHRQQQDLTYSEQILGSLRWSSPEQVFGDSKRLDARCDVHALGLIAYWAVTGSFPYVTDGPIRHVLNQIGRARPCSIVEDTALNEIVQKALSKRPAQRQPNGAVLAEDLNTYLRGLKPKRQVKFGWMRPKLLTAAASALVVTSAFIASRAAHDAPAMNLPVIVNSVGMPLMRIPAGTFIMGSPTSEHGRDEDEWSHRVTISHDFFLAKFEITREQFCDVMGMLRPSVGSSNLPAVNVSWEDAVEFCRRLSDRERRTYRLPTEAEWEYACRAGGVFEYATDLPLESHAWYAKSGSGLHAGGGRAPNYWGICDMLGNAAEWCSDYYQHAYSGIVIDPAGPQLGGTRVVRGGSFLDSALDCRVGKRSARDPRIGWPDLGFRVVVEVELQSSK